MSSCEINNNNSNGLFDEAFGSLAFKDFIEEQSEAVNDTLSSLPSKRNLREEQAYTQKMLKEKHIRQSQAS